MAKNSCWKSCIWSYSQTIQTDCKLVTSDNFSHSYQASSIIQQTVEFCGICVHAVRRSRMRNSKYGSFVSPNCATINTQTLLVSVLHRYIAFQVQIGMHCRYNWLMKWFMLLKLHTPFSLMTAFLQFLLWALNSATSHLDVAPICPYGNDTYQPISMV